MRRTSPALALTAFLLACSEPEPAPPAPEPSTPPELIELAPWPAGDAVRPHPPTGIEIAPVLLRGHRNRRTPSPDTVAQGSARPASEPLFAATRTSLANRSGDREQSDFNQLVVLRVRQSGAPAPSAIVVAVPGLYAGAGSLQVLGIELVQAAAAKGLALEFWAVDRRSNLFEDRAGLALAAEANDPKKALAYYGLDGAEPGADQPRHLPLPHKELLFQAEWGLDTHLRDYRAAVLAARQRAPRVFLGGHSIGGIQTALYAGYDFAAPGEAELLGSADLDGVFLIDGVPSPNASSAEAALQAYLDGGAPSDFGFPMPGLRELRTPRDGEVLQGTYLSVKGLMDPPLLQTLSIAGLGALHAPDAVASVTVPAPFVISGGPQTLVGPWRAIFPAALDDDLVTVSALRFSLGFPAGAPGSLAPGKRQSDRANPNDLFAIGPTSEQAPLAWLDHVAVGEQPANPDVPQYGEAEFQDWRSTAQTFAGGAESDFLEWYFPLRLLLDLQLAADLGYDTARVSDGELANDLDVEKEQMRHGEPALRLTALARADVPVLAIRGELGVLQGKNVTDRSGAEKKHAPFARMLAPARGGAARLLDDGAFGPGFEVVTVDGYTHTDVVLAVGNRCVPHLLAFIERN